MSNTKIWPHPFTEMQMYKWFQDSTIKYHIQEDGSHLFKRINYIAEESWREATKNVALREAALLTRLEEVNDKYYALLSCISDVTPGESRHDSALRLLKIRYESSGAEATAKTEIKDGKA